MKRARTFAAATAVVLLALAWFTTHGPRFSWAGRLPAAYRLRATGEVGVLYAAKTRDKAYRAWVYDSPYDKARTVRDLAAAFPKAEVVARFGGTQLFLDGPDGPQLAIGEKGKGGPVTVYAHSERIAPGAIARLLARVLPVHPPELTTR